MGGGCGVTSILTQSTVQCDTFIVLYTDGQSKCIALYYYSVKLNLPRTPWVKKKNKQSSSIIVRCTLESISLLIRAMDVDSMFVQ